MLFLFALVYALVGLAIGRILFVKRMGSDARYIIEKPSNSWGEIKHNSPDEVIGTDTLASAQTYGLWSLVLWPLTLAVYYIQTPTPTEKKLYRIEEMQKAEEALKELAEKYDLKLKVK